MALFSQSWHQIGGSKVAIRPGLSVSQQVYDDDLWYVLFEPVSQTYFRVSDFAWQFLERLTCADTIDNIWQHSFQTMPEQTPDQDEILSVLVQLSAAGFLTFADPISADRQFAKARAIKAKENRTRLMNFLFFRVRLFNPDPMLERLTPLFPYIMNKPVAAIWIATLLGGLVSVFFNLDHLFSQSQSILAFENLILLYVTVFIVKSLHELGHGIACKYFGGSMPNAGVMFLIFAPVPFVDATSTWRFGDRIQRIWVGAAGMIVEVWLAAVAALVWANSPPGLINALAYNIMFVAFVTTLAFNLNPLLRFDGYYIFSDLTNRPNLGTRAKAMFKMWVDETIYKIPVNKTEPYSSFLLTYQVLSWVYRMSILIGILLFVSSEYPQIGLILAVFFGFLWWVWPISKAVAQIIVQKTPDAQAKIGKSWAVIFGIPLVLLAIIPMPNGVRAPGVVEPIKTRFLYAEDGGRLANIFAKEGDQVTEGQQLFLLTNPDLVAEHGLALTNIERLSALAHATGNDANKDRRALTGLIAAAEKTRDDLAARIEALSITAPFSGTLMAPDLDKLQNAWLTPSHQIGQVNQRSAHKFTAVIKQERAFEVFADTVQTSDISVRLAGKAGMKIPVTAIQLVPYSQDYLPSETMTLLGGGDIAVAGQDEHGIKAAEPFFMIHATLAQSEDQHLLAGHSGTLRIGRQPRPLLVQAWVALNQFFQSRYQL